MQRFVMIGLISALVLAVPAVAARAEVVIGGDVETRLFYSNNLSDGNSSRNDQEGFADGRFRLKLAAAGGVGAGVLWIDFLNTTGRSAATLDTGATDAIGRRRYGAAGFGGAADAIGVREAYLRLNLPAATLLLGRHAVRLGNGLLLDDVADGLSVVFPLGPTSLTFGGFKLIEADANAAAPTTGVDTDLVIANLAIAPPGRWLLQLFALALRDRGPGLTLTPAGADGGCGGAANCPLGAYGNGLAMVYAAGFSVESSGMPLRLGLETDLLHGAVTTHDPTAFNLGARRVAVDGLNVLARAGFAQPRWDLGLTALYSSGQNPHDDPAAGGHKLNLNAIAPNYVFGYILVNNDTHSDRDGGNVGNLLGARAALGVALTPDLRAELAVLWARTRERAAIGAPTKLGYEFDAGLGYRFDAHVQWSNGLGILVTGDAWPAVRGDPAATNNLIKVFSKLSVTF